MTEKQPTFQELADKAHSNANSLRLLAFSLLSAGAAAGLLLGASHAEPDFKTQKGMVTTEEYAFDGVLVLGGVYAAIVGRAQRREYEISQQAANTDIIMGKHIAELTTVIQQANQSQPARS